MKYVFKLVRSMNKLTAKDKVYIYLLLFTVILPSLIKAIAALIGVLK